MRMSYLIAPFTTSVRPRGVLRVYNSIPFAKQTRERDNCGGAERRRDEGGGRPALAVTQYDTYKSLHGEPMLSTLTFRNTSLGYMVNLIPFSPKRPVVEPTKSAKEPR